MIGQRYLTVRYEATAKDYRRVVAMDTYCAAYISGKAESRFEGLVIGHNMHEEIQTPLYITYIMTYQRLKFLFGPPIVANRQGNCYYFVKVFAGYNIRKIVSSTTKRQKMHPLPLTGVLCIRRSTRY